MGVGRVNALTARAADDPSGVLTVAPDSGAVNDARLPNAAVELVLRGDLCYCFS